MKLKETDIKKLLPLFMQADKEWRGLSDGVNKVLQDIAADLPKLSTWDQLDALTDAELDELAAEIRCLWYKNDYSIEKKRALLKSAEAVYRTLGTVYAVEEVVSEVFDGTATVKEWFEAGCDPHYFQIETTSADILSGEKLTEFLRILNIVKRKSQWLEKIIIMLKADADGGLFIGETLQDAGYYHQFVENRFPYDPRSELNIIAGVIYHDASFDNISLA